MGLVRLLLAISVVIVHSHSVFGVRLDDGQAAVSAFYVISGFYMALVLNTKYPAGGRGYLVFLGNRFLRLLPVYWAVLLLAIAVGVSGLAPDSPVKLWRDYARRFTPATATYMVANQALILGQDALMFMRFDPTDGTLHFAPERARNPFHARAFQLDPPAWSLGVELLFYIVAPLIVRKLDRILPLIFVSFLVRLFLIRQFGWRHDMWAYCFFPSELAWFLCGSLGYHVYARCQRRGIDLARCGAWALLLAVGLIAARPLLDHLPLRSLIFVVLMIPCVPLIFAATRSNRFDRAIGELSYPLYLCHAPLAMVLDHWYPTTQPLGGVLLLACSIPAALALYWAIDIPVEHWRQRIAGRALARVAQLAEQRHMESARM